MKVVLIFMNINIPTVNMMVENAKSGNLDWLRENLPAYPTLTQTGGIRALRAAVQAGNTEVVRFLLGKIHAPLGKTLQKDVLALLGKQPIEISN